MEMGTSSSSSGLVKAKSETLSEALKSSSLDFSNGGGSSHGRKQHVRASSSPSQSGISNYRRNTHIRKAKTLDLGRLTGGEALSRASSASLGLSFSFTGFAVPHEEEIIPSERSCSNDDNLEDIEAATSSVVKLPEEPTFPIYLKFIDITYKVTCKAMTSSSEKSILNGISGSAYPGELLALMGPSGSGKTTLLNVLGGRFNQQNTSGSVSYNDKPFSKHLKSRIGFVTQDDVLFPHLTVKETLTYTALLRLPKTLTKQEKEQRAVSVIQELGLERCQDTMIGGSFVRGVSGGERKRVCIGNEIMTNPSLLFLDEPTSCLDSTTALKIVQMLQSIAKAGKTIVTTIHQPSSRLFHRFDKLVVLSRGSLLYFGKASEAMPYFSSIGCSPLLSMNPAEFLLDLANGNMNDISIPSALKEVSSCSKIRPPKSTPTAVYEYLEEAYKTQIEAKEKKKLMEPVPLDEEVKLMITCPKREWGLSWWDQYCILSLRGFKERKHDYFSWLRVTQVLSTAIILGLLWWQSDIQHPKGLQDQVGLLFFIAVFWGFFPVFTAIFTFPQERAMLSKERESNIYRLSAYFVARTTSDLPLDLILPVLFLVVVYFMAGLRLRAESFFLSVLTVFLCIVAAQGLGLAIGASLMDLKKATTLASVTVMTFMLAGGYFVKKVPMFIAWIRYMSFNYHTYKLLVKVQYEEIMQDVNGEEIVSGLKEDTENMLIMERLKSPPPLMIVSDLDHTMVDHQDHDNLSLLRFNSLWEEAYRRDSLLVFSTARSPILYKELRKEKPLLTPDIIITSIGTEIAFGNSMVPDHSWVETLNTHKWNQEIVLEETRKFPELTLQPKTEQRLHKVSFYIDEGKGEAVTKELSHLLEKRGLDVKIIHSWGMNLDVIPRGGGKGEALEYLLKKLKAEGMSPVNTLACGDSEHDAELFSIPDVHGVMVSNSQEELLKWHTENALNNSKLIHSSERCADGILQAIDYFKLGPTLSPRDASEFLNGKADIANPGQEVVRFYLFYERLRRGEIKKYETYIASFKESCDQDAVFFHPSGEEKSLREAIDELRKYNGDRSGKKFWVWVDQVLVIDNISGKCIVKFDKWEQCEDERKCCTTTVEFTSKGRGCLVWEQVKQIWSEESELNDENNCWII
ncbi:unnamed protein product [Brassica rapa subsp. narinosa]